MLDIQLLGRSCREAKGCPDRPRLTVLDNINSSVPKNQFVCLLGASGRGKALLLRIVAGLCGRQINPRVVKGQVKGSVVQAHSAIRCSNGWVTTSRRSPVEYFGKNNPLRMKRAGETACISVLGAIISAVETALEPFGVRIFEFPLSPARLFELTSAARERSG